MARFTTRRFDCYMDIQLGTVIEKGQQKNTCRTIGNDDDSFNP